MLHLPALPGAANASLSMDRIAERAAAEASIFAKAGFDAVIVENFGDAPFASDAAPRETVAAMAIVVGHVVRAVPLPVGANVLRNDALAALAIAATSGAAFIRVNILSGVYATDQGSSPDGRANYFRAERKSPRASRSPPMSTSNTPPAESARRRPRPPKKPPIEPEPTR